MRTVGKTFEAKRRAGRQGSKKPEEKQGQKQSPAEAVKPGEKQESDDGAA